MGTKSDLITKLQQDIFLWEGYKPAGSSHSERIGLGSIEDAFPSGIFPRTAIHEFTTLSTEDLAASAGFIAGLLSKLMRDGAACIWVSTARNLFPASLHSFNVAVERILFIDCKSEKQVLWILEEALKCKGLAAVVGEIDTLSLVDSRRLQLAVEKGGVTGFILRRDAKRMVSSIATARWQISPLPSQGEPDMPGIGFPRWQVALLKVRSGIPGKWVMEWAGDEFLEVKTFAPIDATDEERQVG